MGNTLKVRRASWMNLGAGRKKVGRDKSSGSRTDRPRAAVQVGMEGDGAWPAEPACCCPGLRKIESILVQEKLADASPIRKRTIPDSHVRQAADGLVGICPTCASEAAGVRIY